LQVYNHCGKLRHHTKMCKSKPANQVQQVEEEENGRINIKRMTQAATPELY